ncbi:MAG TPA: hypothetical protein VG407_10890 [Caulobacteraceae bacterium]|jgi:hypothetical protein|nr:hypothetical protein [Caulobacteraceae bacterium]
MLDDPDFLDFLRRTVRSVWGVELVLLLRRTSPRTWTSDDLVLEMRASAAIVNGALAHLEAAGLVARDADGVRYAPAAPELDVLTAELEACYRERPVRLVNAIVSPDEDKLKTFADAFRLKEPKP